MRLLELLDRPIAYHRCFVPLAGGVAGAIMLSQAVYWQARCPSGRDGWWWKTADEWEEETGIKKDAQLTARRALRLHGFWQEKRQGIPARAYYRIDVHTLEKALKIQISGTPTTGCRDSLQLDVANPVCKPTGIASTNTEISSETPSYITQPAEGGKPGEQPKVVRLSFANEFGFAWSPSHQRLLDESRACSILKHEGIEDAGTARRIVAEWAAMAARCPDGDPVAALVWACRNQLAATADGDQQLSAWS